MNESAEATAQVFPAADRYRLGELLYANPLASPEDGKELIAEGACKVSFPDGRMLIENELDPKLGQKSNFVVWLDREFPDDVSISWEFQALQEPGLAIMFFSARAQNGGSIFQPGLAERTGIYAHYHHGDIHAYHIGYFRRKDTRDFNTIHLRKSYGHHLVAEGADPLPAAEEQKAPYPITLIKCGPRVEFFVRDLRCLAWTDDGKTYGPVLGPGRIGFRQMAPLRATYANLRVHKVEALG